MEPNRIDPIPPIPPAAEPPRRPRSVVGPAILILLGLAFLAHNLGLFQFNVWEAMWRLWPVWLIAAGLDLLISRRSSWGSWVVLGLVMAIVGGSVWFFNNVAPTNFAAENISVELNGAKEANVEIRAGVGELRIDSHDGGKLVEGVVYRLGGERLYSNASGSGDQIRYTLKSEGFTGIPGFNFDNYHFPDGTWNLKLNRNVPMDLVVGTGVGKSTIDLSDLNLTDLRVNTGVGEATVILPDSGQLSVRVESGIGKVVVEIPRGMAARIRAENGIGHVSISGDYRTSGSYHESPNYDTAQNRVDVRINGGIGEVIVRER